MGCPSSDFHHEGESKIIAILRTRTGCLKEIYVPESSFRPEFVHYEENDGAEETWPRTITFVCVGRTGRYAIFEEEER